MLLILTYECDECRTLKDFICTGEMPNVVVDIEFFPEKFRIGTDVSVQKRIPKLFEERKLSVLADLR